MIIVELKEIEKPIYYKGYCSKCGADFICNSIEDGSKIKDMTTNCPNCKEQKVFLDKISKKKYEKLKIKAYKGRLDD